MKKKLILSVFVAGSIALLSFTTFKKTKSTEAKGKECLALITVCPTGNIAFQCSKIVGNVVYPVCTADSRKCNLALPCSAVGPGGE